MESFTEDVLWNLVGDTTVAGKDQFERILTHGKDGAESGVITMEDGRTYQIADGYEFSGAKGTKTKSIISFVIQSKKH